ncbi:MAG: hypothetical protein BGO31_10305 [Bacteroidetes bacterium 43-16]|nr:MAG: hypothetical protein BGO31_10305 [Bacteroidetes bacterium 43-16]
MKANKIIKYLVLASVFVVGVMACSKKYPGDSYDFSSTAKRYIQLAPGQAVEINAETVDTLIINGTDTTEAYYYIPSAGTLTVATREGLAENVNIVIEYVSPNATRTLNQVYPKFSQSLAVEVNAEDADFGSEDEIEGTLTLKSASGADLRLGYPQEGDNLTVPFIAYKPYVIHEY